MLDVAIARAKVSTPKKLFTIPLRGGHRLEANAERHFRKRRVRAFKLLKLFCSLVRAAAAGRVKGLQPLPCLRSDGKAKRGAKRKEGEWNGRKPLKPTEHDGDVVFSKEKSGEENYSRLFRGVVFI